MQMVDELISHSRELSNFELGDQLIAGDRRRARDDTASPDRRQRCACMLIGLIASNYHRLALAKSLMKQGRKDEASRLVYDRTKRKTRFQYAARRDASAIARDIKLIADADLAHQDFAGRRRTERPKLQLEC